MPEIEPRMARNSGRLRFRKNMAPLLNASRAGYRTEDRFFDSSGRREADVAAAISEADALDGAREVGEGLRVAAPGRGVEADFDGRARFGVGQIQLAFPRRIAILLIPDVQKHEFVAKVGQILQGALAVGLIQKIGNDDDQPALRIFGDELARYLKEIRAAAGF